MKGIGQWMASLVLAASLAACGGGGDGGGSPTLNVSTTGSSAQSASVGNGQSTTLNVQSGDYLQLQASQPVKWAATYTSANTTLTNQTQSDSLWAGNLIAPTGDTISVVATLASDPSKSFTLKLTVAPHRYKRVTPLVNEVATFLETSVDQANVTTLQRKAYTVVGVTASQMTVNGTDAISGALIDSYVQDLDRNRLQRNTPGNSCTYTPIRDLYDMPLYYGKTWTAHWDFVCSPSGRRETAQTSATVEGYEAVSTQGGAFNALRIRYDTTYTLSNDTDIVNGAGGTATYKESTLSWWSTDKGRIVKWQSTFTYPNGTTTTVPRKSFTQELTNLR